MKRYALVALPAVMVMLLATQCGLAPTQVPAAFGPRVTVTDPWARPSPMGAGNGAVYMTLVNEGDGDEALLSVAGDVAEAVELHETTMDENEVMQMSPIARVEIPAGGSASLEPGGKHIMLIGLKQALAPGEKVRLTLNFEHSGPMTVEAEVRDQGAMEGMDMEGMKPSQ